jgi:hypothetical protein
LEAENVEESILWYKEEQEIVEGVQDQDHIFCVFDHDRGAIVVGVEGKEEWEAET